MSTIKKIPAENVPACVVALYEHMSPFSIHWDVAALTLIKESTSPTQAAHESIIALCHAMPEIPANTEKKRSFLLANFKIYKGISFIRGLTSKYGCTSLPHAKRVVRDIVKLGWHNDFDVLTRDLLNRNPTPDEIVALTETYCNNKAVSCSGDELHLQHLANRYCPKNEAIRVAEMLNQFRIDWQNDPGF